MLARSISLVVAALLAQATVSAQETQKPGAGNSPAPTSPDVKVQTTPSNPAPKAPWVAPTPSDNVAPTVKDPSQMLPAVPVSAYALDSKHVLFSRPNAEQLWGGSAAYKMSFERTGTRFIPFLGADAPKDYPLHFAPPSVAVGGAALSVKQDVEPTLSGTRVSFDRGGLVETYDLTGPNVEQSFRFDQLATRGAIDIRVPVTSELQASARENGLVFQGPKGGVSYSQAVAVDAAGARLPLETTSDGGSISIHVPASFVANAKLPLVVDPLVGSTVTVNTSNGGRAENHADIAYDETNGVYLVVWFRDWSATDSDCFAQLLDGTLSLVGGVITIDFTSNAWQSPRVANNNLANNFLVVGQVSASKASPYWVAGVLVDASAGTAGAQFDIANAADTGHASGDKINPDVGGDPETTGPTYYTVVWERVFNSTDHDIHLKQVTSGGTLRSTSPTLIANSGSDNDFRPQISKSDGFRPFSDQSWCIVWEREFTTTDHDIYGTFCDWNGNLKMVGTATEFLIDFSGRSDVLPTVSSPTTPGNGRVYLAAYQGSYSGGDPDIIVCALDLTGTLTGGGTSLQTLENAGTAQTWPQFAPTADCDGCRFVVGYHEGFAGTTADLDVRVSLLGWASAYSTFVVNESRIPAAYTLDQEVGASVVADASAAPVVARPHRFVVGWQNLMGTADDTIEARRYDGFAAGGGFSTRSTGCGSASISASGSSVIGDDVSFNVNASGSFAKAVMFGLPQSVNLSPICSGCVLGTDGSPYPSPLNIAIPCDPVLVGGTASFQGLAIYGGGQPCLSQISLTDTVDLTLR